MYWVIDKKNIQLGPMDADRVIALIYSEEICAHSLSFCNSKKETEWTPLKDRPEFEVPLRQVNSYYVIDLKGDQKGPISFLSVITMLEKNHLNVNNLCYKIGEKDWISINQHHDFKIDLTPGEILSMDYFIEKRTNLPSDTTFNKAIFGWLKDKGYKSEIELESKTILRNRVISKAAIFALKKTAEHFAKAKVHTPKYKNGEYTIFLEMMNHLQEISATFGYRYDTFKEEALVFTRADFLDLKDIEKILRHLHSLTIHYAEAATTLIPINIIFIYEGLPIPPRIRGHINKLFICEQYVQVLPVFVEMASLNVFISPYSGIKKWANKIEYLQCFNNSDLKLIRSLARSYEIRQLHK